MISDLLFKAANLVRSGDLNLDISFHANVANTPKWVVKISHTSLTNEKIIKCGLLEKALSEAIEGTQSPEHPTNICAIEN